MAVKASAYVTLTSVVDIEASYRYYLLQSSTLAKPNKPSTNPPGGSWSDSEPTYDSGSTSSLYYVDLTVFADGTFHYTDVSLSTTYESSKEAYNKAVNAQDSADAANEKFDKLEFGTKNLIRNSTNLDFNRYYFASYDEILMVSYDGNGHLTINSTSMVASGDGDVVVTSNAIKAVYDDGNGNVTIT